MKECWDDPGIHMMVGFQGLDFEEELHSLVKEFRVGGIVLFRRNIESPEQLRQLLSDARRKSVEIMGRPLWVAIDQEGGPVQRLPLPFTQLPPARAQSMGGPPEVEKWQLIAAKELRETGIHINFAPVLDMVPPGKNGFMEERSLGSDPQRVGDLGTAWIRTLQKNGVSATAKHFPGLGSAREDPHHDAPVIFWKDREAMERDLLPFAMAVRAGVHCMMTSHARYPMLDPVCPATLSQAVNRMLLRERLGFGGILFSDDMDMAAVANRYTWGEMVEKGLAGGIDFFLLCQHSRNIEPFHGALRKAIASGSGFRRLHLASVQRILELQTIHSPSSP
ncbi:MAG: glycoside hydrolase family 3 protein [Deltaproteobacteria bacterium]|nr:glycoside hydrolase family 3 protein [Deltaproteobacteria bacterium]